jgi:hypothetical protein
LLSDHGFLETAPQVLLLGSSAKPPRATITQLKEDHKLYSLGKIEVEAYMEAVFYYLESNASHEDAFGFFSVYSESIEDGTFCSNKNAFVRVLRQKFDEYLQDRTASEAPAERGELNDSHERDGVEDSDDEDTEPKELAAIKQANNREKIEKAYTNLLAATPNAEGEFFSAVTQFAKGKVIGRTLHTSGSETPDDVSQNIAAYVWQHLKDFRGSPKSFYPWLHRICYVQGAKRFNENLEESTQHAPFFIESEEGEGLIENPALYRTEYPLAKKFRVPDFIQGTDLKICKYIREGFNYARIAGILDISEQAVKDRVRKMRKRVEVMKAAHSE